MPSWLIWLIASGVLAAAETTSLSLVLVMGAGGAAAGAVAAALGAPVLLQFIVAIVATVALLGVVRPIAQRHLVIADPAITGSDALVGMAAVVLSAVDAKDGRVRLNGGEWSARCYDPDQTLAVGTVVRVVQISGATELVLPED
jgi:membrane protein implicated in regulation of membrane protease activity